MPRQKTANGRITGLVPVSNSLAFETAGWWKKLSVDEQREVKDKGFALASEFMSLGTSRIKAGELLSELKGILTPHNAYQKFLKNYFHMTVRTADRWVLGYRNASKRLPEPVIRAAVARGFNLIGDSEDKPFGVYTAAIKKLPPPKQATEKNANEYLDQLDQVRKQVREKAAASGGMEILAPSDPDVLLKECFKYIMNRFGRLSTRGKARQTFLTSLVGMVINKAGVTHQAFDAVAIPDEYLTGRGRPAKEKPAEAQQEATASA